MDHQLPPKNQPPPPDHRSAPWLLYCLTAGLSQREMGKLAGVSAYTIRSWLQKLNIKWRSISQSLRAQSAKVSARARGVWSDAERRARQSRKMVEVQAQRRSELSASAKANWQKNRDKLVAGIRAAAQTSLRRAKLAQATKRLWQTASYRQQILAQRQLFDTSDYRHRIATALRGSKKTTAEYVAEAAAIWHNAFDYSRTDFQGWTRKIFVICARCHHGFWQLPAGHLRFGNCQRCNISGGQRLLFDHLQSYQPVLNDRTQIAPFELDIFLPAQRLAIEHHGLYWHSYDRPESAEERMAHQHKWHLCQARGIRLLQFFEHEVLQHTELIIAMINNQLHHKPIKAHARQLSVTSIHHQEAADFFGRNHLQGYRSAKITLALRHQDQILMAMSFSPIATGYEIIRMATKMGYCIRGGASRLLRHFIERFRPSSILTFANLRYADGHTYEKLGFTAQGITRPGYFYCKGLRVWPRQKCQKHKLASFLSSAFDPTATEAANMFAQGYRRLWDAGHLRYVLHPGRANL